MIKLALTWPSGFKSAISSGCGRRPGASVAVEKLAAQLGCADSTAAVVSSAAPKVEADSKENRCATGRSGAPVSSKPPSEPTPEPMPTSSSAGIFACGIETAGAAAEFCAEASCDCELSPLELGYGEACVAAVTGFMPNPPLLGV